LKKPWKTGLFLVKGSSVAQVGYCSVLGQWPSRTICRTFCVPDVRQDEPMIYIAKSSLKPAKITYLCRWRDADGHRQTRRLTHEESARVLLGWPRGKRAGGAK